MDRIVIAIFFVFPMRIKKKKVRRKATAFQHKGYFLPAIYRGLCRGSHTALENFVMMDILALILTGRGCRQ